MSATGQILRMTKTPWNGFTDRGPDDCTDDVPTLVILLLENILRRSTRSVRYASAIIGVLRVDPVEKIQ